MNAEYLTMAEIEKKYPNEWVLIDRPKTNRSQRVLGGYVAMHSPDREEFDRRLDEHPEVIDGAILYTGEPSPDEIWLLNL